MRRGGVFAVVGGLLIAGATAFSYPYWWPIGRELFSRQSDPIPPRTPEENRAFLEKRVREYWQARMQNDRSRTFQYEHPVQQEQVGESTYKQRLDSAIAVKDFTVLSIRLHPDGEMADVRLGAKYTHDFRLPGAKPMAVSTQFTDYWQKEQGVWYHVLDYKVIPDGRPVITKKTTPQG